MRRALVTAALVAGAVFALFVFVDVPPPILRVVDSLTHRRREPVAIDQNPTSRPVRSGLELKLAADGTPFMIALAKHVREDAAAAALGVRPEVEAWGTERGGRSDRTDAYLTGPDRETLTRVITEAAVNDPSLRLPDGLQIGYQALSGADHRWRTYLLHTETVLTGRSVAEAEVATSDDHPTPFVFAELDGEGRRQLAEVTSANVGRKMAIMVDGQIVTAPVITGAITAGRIQVDVGSTDPAVMKDEAYALVAALRAGSLAEREITAETVDSLTLDLARGACALAAGLIGGLLVVVTRRRA